MVGGWCLPTATSGQDVLQEARAPTAVEIYCVSFPVWHSPVPADLDRPRDRESTAVLYSHVVSGITD